MDTVRLNTELDITKIARGEITLESRQNRCNLIWFLWQSAKPCALWNSARLKNIHWNDLKQMLVIKSCMFVVKRTDTLWHFFVFRCPSHFLHHRKTPFVMWRWAGNVVNTILYVKCTGCSPPSPYQKIAGWLKNWGYDKLLINLSEKFGFRFLE